MPSSDRQRLVIVSNRLPISAEERGGEVVFHPSSGGLATGMGSVYGDYRALWVGWPGSVAERDRDDVARRLLDEHSCHPVWLSQDLVDRYYEGFANDTIWPLFHSMSSYARYSANGWEAYRDVNAIFRDAVLQVARNDDIVWVHDYHLMLLPGLLRERLPNVRIGFFLHIPFPHYDMLRLLPWHEEIARSLLASDLIGFHTYDYVQSFLDAVRLLLGYDNSLGRIMMSHRVVQTDVFPMGIDFRKFSGAVESAPVRAEIEKRSRQFDGRKLFFTVARLDYTKGIPQTISAVGRFFDKFPRWRTKAVFLIVIVPSREGVDRYAELKRKIDEWVGAINSRIGTIEWVPIVYMYRSLSFEELVASYARADVFMALSLRDGMNLTVKEYLAASSDDDGALIVSEMAGAAKELREALIVNPNDEEDIADTFDRALSIPEDEKIQRCRTMRNRLEAHDVRFWARRFLDRLDATHALTQKLAVKMLSADIDAEIGRKYFDAKRRLILLDYDGTLVSFRDDPEAVVPSDDVMRVLRALTADPANRLFLLSGRDRHFLERWFGELNLSLVGEHGAWRRDNPRGQWKQAVHVSDAWKARIMEIMTLFVDRIPGSFVEEKSFSLSWHYRASDLQTGPQAARELIDTLTHLTANLDIHVLPGNKVVEVKSTQVGKGEFYRMNLAREPFDFILAVGDDWTDETLFASLPPSAFSIRVGYNVSSARYNIRSPDEVLVFLAEMCRSESKEDR